MLGARHPSQAWPLAAFCTLLQHVELCSVSGQVVQPGDGGWLVSGSSQALQKGWKDFFGGKKHSIPLERVCLINQNIPKLKKPPNNAVSRGRLCYTRHFQHVCVGGRGRKTTLLWDIPSPQPGAWRRFQHRSTKGGPSAIRQVKGNGDTDIFANEKLILLSLQRGREMIILVIIFPFLFFICWAQWERGAPAPYPLQWMCITFHSSCCPHGIIHAW